MVAERRFASPENYAYVALLFSLLRPDLQGFLKLQQDAVNPAISAITNPYNLTGLAFSGTAPYGTNFGNNFNFIPTKQDIASSGYNDPLSQYLDWSSNAQFNNSGVAMILGDTQVTRNHLDSESGYSSAEEVYSPLSNSSFRTQSSRQIRNSYDDLSELGATGYTLPPNEYTDSLEDYVDLEYLANVDPNKASKGSFDVAPDLPLTFKQEPDYLLDKFTNPETLPYSTDLKASPGGNNFPNDFELGLESKDFDPLAVDFGQTFTNSSFQYPFDNDLESMINFDELATLDFNLPSDILTTDQNGDPSNNIESQLENLLQGSSQLRNGSGDYPSALTTVTPLDNPKKLTNIPSTSSVAVSKKKTIKSGKKKVPAAKKLAVIKEKTMESESPVDMSDEAIIDMAVDEFNILLESLTEDQAKYVRDVRRRGKNKEAARVCRKRKLEVIDDLEDELKRLRLEKQKVLDERRAILEETATLKSKVNELEASVFSSFTDEHGRPLSSSEYSLLQGANGTLYIGKNIDNTKQKKST